MSVPRFTLGWVYNLDEVPSTTSTSSVIGLACAFPSIAVLSVLARIALRRSKILSLGLDDFAVAASALLAIAYSGITIYQTRWGLGLPAEAFPPVNAITYSKVQFTGGPVYCLAILGFKVSLLASYHRLAGFNRNYRIVINTVMALVVANQVIYTFLLSFGCRPIAKIWNPSLEGTCINTLASYFGLGISSLIFDLLIIALPFPILQRLQLRMREKVVLGTIFALGFFVTLTQVFRIRTIAELKNYTDSENIIKWSIVEMNLGIFVACVPSFAPLLRFIGRKAVTGYRSQSRGLGPRGQVQDAYGQSYQRRSRVIGGDSHRSRLDSEDDKIALWEQKDWAGLVQQREIHAEPSSAEHVRATGANSPEAAEGYERDIHVVREVMISSQHR
ncbi:hypothetical protein B9Z65_6999 [Elsinoe australis]|uniref:Rhodopsin domain-containing protein n=1 Tax=Elsinoe australis TaxID=40998 RepID=A0A2P7Z4A4_9PEZI|nr:hypothetical protein B9Z65_6999 [Elsinoe australis]